MAAMMLLILAIDTGITGWLIADRLRLRRELVAVAEVQHSITSGGPDA